MNLENIWLLIHLMTFVYWVGADLGVFYSARLVVNPNYSFATRLSILNVLSWIDMIPRYMLLLTFPVGLILSYFLDLVPQNKFILFLVFAFFITWIVLVFKIHKAEGTKSGLKMARLDLYLRIVFIIILLVLCVSSFTINFPFKSDWLIIKVLLFTCTILCGIGIRITFKPFVEAFKDLSINGTSDIIEEKMKRSLNHAVPFVLGIWFFSGVAAFIGLSHERLF